MTHRINKFREAVARLERDRAGRVRELTRELRGEAVAIARERQDAGESLPEIADALSLNRYTLRLWLRKAGVPVLRRVRVSGASLPSRSSTGLPVLVTPGGFRVEGLDVESLGRLLKGLS